MLPDLMTVSRRFEYDYIYIDAIFLAIWITFLLKKKKYTALLAGFILAIPIYIIDAVIWWNLPTSAGVSGYVREYWIGGVQMPHPLSEYFWLKFGADFMMTISYSIFAFSWVWIMFQSWKTKNKKDMTLFTSWWFISWLLIPILSFAISWDDTIVYCIRHMGSQFVLQIVVVVVGYGFMFLFYGTDKFNSKNTRVIFYAFMVGCIQGFVMEFPLFLTSIRPMSLELFIFEVIFLKNQGVPYLYIIWDKISPIFKKKNEKYGTRLE